ncbi:MAG TPA: TonB-dependent receptor [Thermoanaerobaculia bacterium]|nr:TonB-dependent receptor [Thermoanaerobaculia bacterium]
MRATLTRLASIAALILALPSALAQEQAASIHGSVKDSSGGVLAGVTVEVKSAVRGVRFTHITDTSGTYRIPTLPAGRYTVTATLFGFNRSIINVDLLLGQALRVDHAMRIGVVDAITVTLDAPLLDVRGSASTTSYRSDEFEHLPIGRDFSSVVTLSPAANRERASGGISVDGASGSENRFVIDGVDTTDARDGSQAKALITDFVDEVQVKTAGYAAEFGGATGGVINVVTRRGTNQFRGEVYGYGTTHSLNGAERPQLELALGTPAAAQAPRYRKDDFSQLEPGLSLGGPILPDRLFFFAAYQPRLTRQRRTVDYAGLNAGRSRTFQTDTTTRYASANLNGSIGSRLSYKLAANFSPTEREGLAFPTFPLDFEGGQGGAVNRNGRGSPDVDTGAGRRFDNESYSAYVDAFPSQTILLGFRAGRFETNTRDTGIPNEILHKFSANAADPAIFPEIPASLLRSPGFSSVATNSAVARDRYTRDAVSADATWYLRAWGEHAIKAGFQQEKIRNDVFSGELQPSIEYVWGRAHAGTGRRGQYGYFTVRQFATTGDVEENIRAIYLQDAWTIRDRLTMNLGVRAESEDVPQYRAGAGTFINFGFQDKLAPRLGFAYDLFGNGRTKVYASYGTFFDVTKLEWPRGSSGGEVWVDYHFTLDDPDWTRNICSVGRNTTADRPACPAGTFITASDRRFFDPASVAETLDPAIRPMETRELTIGAEQAVSAVFSIGFRLVHKELVRTIEDMGVLVGDDEIYIYGNPGSGLSRSLGAVPMPRARRDYDAVEVQASRRVGSALALRASYTWSRLYGNYSGLANSDEVLGRGAGRRSPNVNRAFDGLAQAFDQNLEPTYGHLPTDRPHQLKVQATFAAPFGTTIGLHQYAGSGTPQTTEVNLYPTLPFFPYGRGDMGRTPMLTQTDLSLQHEMQIGGRYGLQLMVSVLNVFDEDTELYRWNRLLLGDLPEATGITQFTFFDAPFDFGEVLAANAKAVGSMRDPRYGKPFLYQDPRLVRVGMRLRF